LAIAVAANTAGPGPEGPINNWEGQSSMSESIEPTADEATDAFLDEIDNAITGRQQRPGQPLQWDIAVGTCAADVFEQVPKKITRTRMPRSPTAMGMPRTRARASRRARVVARVAAKTATGDPDPEPDGQRPLAIAGGES
jgi:hypothetical protein